MDKINRTRDLQGKYQAKLDRICTCSHTNGQHTAARGRFVGQSKSTGIMQQPCLEDGCSCECFKAVRVRKTMDGETPLEASAG